jgi:hypothetical protein
MGLENLLRQSAYRWLSEATLAPKGGEGYLNQMRFRSGQLVFMLSAAAVLGCKKEEIQVYQAPKDVVAPAPAMAAKSPAGEASAERPPWTVPAGWNEKPREAGSMRIASYGVTTPDGRSADISVVPLGPVAGSELDNVNRWRNQIGLDPLTDAELTAQTQSAPIGTLASKLYDMVGDKPTLDGKYKARTLAGVLSVEGTTVFFKMTGEDALVAESKPKFLAWLKSVDTGGSSEPTPRSAPTSPAAPAATPPGMAGPVTPPPATGQPQWEAPASWKTVPASTMRVASFAVGDGGDFSVVALGPGAGGTLANLNRWRGQLGLNPVSEADISTVTTTLDLAGGEKAIVADLAGEGPGAGKKMLAAIVARADRTWFYKLTGSATLVTQEHENFVKFVKSVKY